jgi:hypothetical protein
VQGLAAGFEFFEGFYNGLRHAVVANHMIFARVS